jgi:hypothetical protein
VFGYYGNSVAMRFAPFRRSRLCSHTTLARVGSPFISLPRSLPDIHRRELLLARDRLVYFHAICQDVLLRCRRFKDAAAGALFRHWKLGFNQSRFSLACKTCSTSQYILSCLAAFLPCYFPLHLSVPGRAGVLEGSCSQPSIPLG